MKAATGTGSALIPIKPSVPFRKNTIKAFGPPGLKSPIGGKMPTSPIKGLKGTRSLK